LKKDDPNPLDEYRSELNRKFTLLWSLVTADNFLRGNFCNFFDATRELVRDGVPIKMSRRSAGVLNKNSARVSDDDNEELSSRPAGCVTRPNYYSGTEKFKSSRHGLSSPGGGTWNPSPPPGSLTDKFKSR